MRVDAVVVRPDGQVELRYSLWADPAWEGHALEFGSEAALDTYLADLDAKPTRAAIEAKRGIR